MKNNTPEAGIIDIDAMSDAVDRVFVEHKDGDRHVIGGKLSEGDKQELLEKGVVFRELSSPSPAEAIEAKSQASPDAARLTGAAILTAAERKGGVIEHAILD